MSSVIMQRLHHEHVNLARLLRYFQAEVAKLGTDERPPITMIQDMLDYISQYPERWHHPLEDMVFEHLLTKNPEGQQKLRQVMAEHESLERLTAQLKVEFDALAMDRAVPMDRLKSDAEKFLTLQLEHLNLEEAEIYPMAEKYLGDGDWKELEQRLQTSDDPIFDVSKAEFEHVLQAIIDYEQEQA